MSTNGGVILGTDLDDVLVPTKWYFARFLRDERGWDVDPNRPHYRYDFSIWVDLYDLPNVETVKEEYGRFMESEIFKNMEPIEESQKGIRRAHEEKGWTIHIKTSRPNSIEELTNEWVRYHYPQISQVHFGNYYLEEGEKVSKSQLCESVIAQIDDRPDHSLEVAKNGKPVFIYPKRPWNSDYHKGSESHPLILPTDIFDDILYMGERIAFGRYNLQRSKV